MKRQTRKSKKWLIVVLLLAIVIVGGGVYSVTAKTNNWWPWQRISKCGQNAKCISSNYSTKSNDKTKSQSNSETTSNPAGDSTVNLTPNPDSENSYVSNPTDSTKAVQPFITRATLQGVSVIFNSAAAGTCQLTISRTGTQDIVLTTNVIWQNQYLCYFDLTSQSLSGSGWSATVVNVVGDQTSASANTNLSGV